MGEQIIALRNFNMAYIWLDSAFLIVFAVLLLIKRKYLTFLWGLAGGILYFLVDYGIFYRITGTRSISVAGITLGNSGTLLVLIWLSLSYGVTNFAWIWLCLGRDEHIKEWSFLIFGWWIVCPMLASLFPASAAVQTIRSTGSYHGIMAAILIVTYLALIIYNLRQEDRELRVNILRLCAIGVAIQFGWEFALLIGGIRSSSADISTIQKIKTLIVNSLLETNLGMPSFYVIFLAVTNRFAEDLSRRRHTFKQELLLSNRRPERKGKTPR